MGLVVSVEGRTRLRDAGIDFGGQYAPNGVDYGWGGVYNLELFGNDSTTTLFF
jgi:hypothetical protein